MGSIIISGIIHDLFFNRCQPKPTLSALPTTPLSTEYWFRPRRINESPPWHGISTYDQMERVDSSRRYIPSLIRSDSSPRPTRLDQLRHTGLDSTCLAAWLCETGPIGPAREKGYFRAWKVPHGSELRARHDGSLQDGLRNGLVLA